MVMDDDRVDLFKPLAPQPEPPPAGPAWIVVPARAIALVVVLPFRLVYDLFMLIGRGIRGLMRTLGRALYRWLLRPVGLVFAAIGRGIAAVFDFLLIRPLRWLFLVLGRGTGRLGRWLYRVFLTPIGRFFAWIGRGIARVIGAVAGAVATAVAWLFAVLIVLPLALLWRYVLSPPLRGLWWLLRGIGTGLAYVGRGIAAVFRAIGSGIAAVWRVIAAAFAWAWRTASMILRRLGRVLIVIPALAVWRYVLRPIGLGIAWVWRTFVVLPARWIGNVIRTVWRVTVRAPLRWINQSLLLPVREAARDVRLQLRRAFRG